MFVTTDRLLDRHFRAHFLFTKHVGSPIRCQSKWRARFPTRRLERFREAEYPDVVPLGSGTSRVIKETGSRWRTSSTASTAAAEDVSGSPRRNATRTATAPGPPRALPVSSLLGEPVGSYPELFKAGCRNWRPPRVVQKDWCGQKGRQGACVCCDLYLPVTNITVLITAAFNVTIGSRKRVYSSSFLIAPVLG